MHRSSDEQVGITMRADSRCGYTMLEIMIVITISMVIVGIAFPRFVETVRGMELDGATEQLTSDLRRARIDAMRRNASVYVAKKDSVTYEIQYVGDRKLPSNVVFDGSSPDTVRFASFGPTLTGPVTYTLSSHGYSATVLVEASGWASVN